MAAPRLDLAPHPVLADPLPFEAGDELTGNRDQVAEDVREGLARRLLHREDLYLLRADHQVISVTIDRRIGDEVVQVRLRSARCRR